VPKTADADLHGVRFAKSGRVFLDQFAALSTSKLYDNCTMDRLV
jgi:hypothetical protein